MPICRWLFKLGPEQLPKLMVKQLPKSLWVQILRWLRWLHGAGAGHIPCPVARG